MCSDTITILLHEPAFLSGKIWFRTPNVVLCEVMYLVSRITERCRAKTRGTLSDLSLVKDTYVESYLGGNVTCNMD